MGLQELIEVAKAAAAAAAAFQAAAKRTAVVRSTNVQGDDCDDNTNDAICRAAPFGLEDSPGRRRGPTRPKELQRVASSPPIQGQLRRPNVAACPRRRGGAAPTPMSPPTATKPIVPTTTPTPDESLRWFDVALVAPVPAGVSDVDGGPHGEGSGRHTRPEPDRCGGDPHCGVGRCNDPVLPASGGGVVPRVGRNNGNALGFVLTLNQGADLPPPLAGPDPSLALRRRR
jgi:hypothetical protein